MGVSCKGEMSMDRLTKWNEETEGVELLSWDEEEWKDFMGSLDVPIATELSIAIEKLANYEDLEEQGRLIKLPYPLGTEKLYFVWDYEIYELNAKEITFYKADKFAIRPYETVISVDSYDFYFDDFGKTVFLTKEKAEKALTEMEK